MTLPARAPRGARRLRCRRGAAKRRRCAVPAARQRTRSFALDADGKEMSTTMAFVRMLGGLLKDKTLGPRVVPIVADEARTFGMASLFRQVGIYSPLGQLYEPEDAGSMLLLPRGHGRPDPRGRHHRGRRARRRGSPRRRRTRARPADAAVLHLLLDVRLPARRRPDLGRGRPARARLPARRDRRTHDARRRRSAAPGRQRATSSPRRCRTAAPTTRRSPASSR